MITQANSGATYRVVVGTHATLHLSGKWTWSTPKVVGRAIELSPIYYIRDPGFVAWDVHAKATGTARIRSYGSPSCRSCTRLARKFTVVVVVRN